MFEADLIWHRAALDSGGPAPRLGDRALADLIYAHGLVMNGGVLHAAELLTEAELSAAASGFRFFGLADVAELLVEARERVEKARSDGVDLARKEADWDAFYVRLVPNDSDLDDRFQAYFREHPYDFASP